MKRATIREIATAAQVHYSTVSLALRHDPRIPKATQRKVSEIAKRLGYVPDPMLSALSAYRRSNRPASFQGVIGWMEDHAHGGKMPQLRGSRDLFEQATQRAAMLGFTLDRIVINAPDSSPARITKILQSRGIQSLVIAPSKEPNTLYDLNWSLFSCVAVGYSVISPNLHRTAPYQFLNTKLLVRKLHEAGYKRPGLCIYRSSDQRVNHAFSGGFLAEQLHLWSTNRVPVLLFETLSNEVLERWLARHRPDVVIGADHWLRNQLIDLGYRIPQDIGFALIAKLEPTPGIAGIDECMGRIGEAAVDFVVNLFHHGEKGVPESPRYHLVKGDFVSGDSIQCKDGHDPNPRKQSNQRSKS